MAHEIAQVNGQWSFAHVGERGWHGLGQRVPDNATIEQWAQAAGLTYRIQRAFVRYATTRGVTDIGQCRTIEDRVVQFREDTGADLGIVSSGYKTDQPIDVLTFFAQWIAAAAVKMETAGALFGGRRYFASALIGDEVDLGGGDSLKPYILLANSCDGSLRRTVSNVVTRPVCNNTVTAALAEGGKTWASTHRSVADWSDARATTEAALAQFGAFVKTAQDLSKLRVNAAQAQDFVAKVLQAPTIDDGKKIAAFDKILALFNGGGAGSQLPTAKGTRWGLLNAVTDWVDHGVRAKSDEHRFASAQQGPGAAMKARAVALLVP